MTSKVSGNSGAPVPVSLQSFVCHGTPGKPEGLLMTAASLDCYWGEPGGAGSVGPVPICKPETSQALTLSRKSTRGKSRRPITPVMTMAASALSGMWRNTGVRHSRTTPMRAAFTRPASPAPPQQGLSAGCSMRMPTRKATCWMACDRLQWVGMNCHHSAWQDEGLRVCCCMQVGRDVPALASLA